MSQVNTIFGPRGGVRWASFFNALKDKGYDPDRNGLEQFAEYLSTQGDDVSTRTVESWLWGQREPTLAGLERIAYALEVPPANLMADRPKKIYPL